MSIPYITGTIEYQRYNVVEERIKKFVDYDILGKDESGQYDLYVIHLGNKAKPKMVVQGSIHGSEWKVTQYSLDFFEKIRDNTYPDQLFRDYLLSNFHLLYVPVVNPYGYDMPLDPDGNQIRKDGRENVNDVDLNRDFFSENRQAETNIIRRLLDTYKPFAFYDLHLRTVRGSNLELHNSQYETEYVRNKFANMWQDYTGETLVINAVSGSSDPSLWNRGLAINYVRDYVKNDHTPFTLSYLSEIGQYDNREGGNTLEETYFYGMGALYAFFSTSIDYFNETNNDQGIGEYVTKIVQDHKTTFLYRNDEHMVMSIVESFKDGKEITTTLKRDLEGNVTSYNRKLDYKEVEN